MSSSPAFDALLAISRADSAATAALDKALSRVGLWLGDLSLLTFVGEGSTEGISRADLALALRQSQSETLRRVKLMEKLNWIERTDAGAFRLSAHGRALLIEATGLAASRSESWLAESLSADEIAALSVTLGKLL